MTEIIKNPPLRQAFDDPRTKWPEWFSRVYTICFSVQHSGTTAQRPTADLWDGRQYWDKTLGKPVYWDAVAEDWVDATGSSA